MTMVKTIRYFCPQCDKRLMREGVVPAHRERGFRYSECPGEDLEAIALEWVSHPPTPDSGKHVCRCAGCINVVLFGDEPNCYSCTRPAFCECGCGCK